MRRISLTFFASISIFILFAAAAGAVHDLFKAMDADNDGKVSKEEFIRDMEKDAFVRLDTNKDGVLTREEWKKVEYLVESDEKEEVFRHVDRDIDKRISLPEFSDYAYKYSNLEEAFMTMDKDLDGSLSPDEVTMRPLFRLITIHY